MYKWRHQTSKWDNWLWGSCGSMLELGVGYRVWWLLVSFWCKSCLQTAGISNNWWTIFASNVCMWCTSSLKTWVVRTVPWSLAYLLLCIPCVYLTLGAQALDRAHFGQGTGPIHLDNLICNSRESRLVNCWHNGISVHNCAHSEDAGLRCQGMYIHISHKMGRFIIQLHL